MARSPAYDSQDLFGSEVWLCLQPKSDGASHHGSGHRCTAVGVPRIRAALEVEMSHIREDIACIGIVLKIETAVGRNDICTRRHDIRLNAIVESRSYRRVFTPHARRSLIIGTIFTHVVDNASTVASSAHANDRRRASWRMKRIGIVAEGSVMRNQIPHPTEQFHLHLIAYDFHSYIAPLPQQPIGLQHHLQYSLRWIEA